MRQPCYKCRFEHKPIDTEPCEYCSNEYMNSGDHPAFEWSKKPTNYDRLISKTPEELARWIADELVEPGYYKGNEAYELWLDWLKEEADNE